jgi:hypothetical protein
MKSIKLRIGAIFILSIFLFNLSGCDDNKIDGGPCDYSTTLGVATIMAVKTADLSDNNCKDAVEIIFNFVPDNPAARSHYRFPLSPDTGRNFVVGDGKNPPGNWALNKGLIEQSSHRCARQEIINGTCTPIIFSFPDIDCTDYATDCF